LQVFYHPEIQINNTITLDKSESAHAIKVLRKKVGDTLLVSNGKASLFKGEITFIDKHSCNVFISECIQNQQHNYNLHIGFCAPKDRDRLEWFIEKSVELGVAEISIITSERSERKKVNKERLALIALAAMKQSMNLILPYIHTDITFKNFAINNSQSSNYIAHCMEGEKMPIAHLNNSSINYRILIGPEGDFTPNELLLALANNYKALDLGTTRLRTETAALYVCSAIKLMHS
jgi:16S rRNA (uracil1498-N3)-methyltransferase